MRPFPQESIVYQVTKYLDCSGSQSAEGPEWRKAYGDTLLNSSLPLPA